MTDARAEQLLVVTIHRDLCTFGGGERDFFRIVLADGKRLYRRDQAAVEDTVKLLPREYVERVDRDGFCLDGMRVGDANTPDVIDAEAWLAMPREQAMVEAGLVREADYARVYRQISEAVSARDNRASQGGVRVPIIIKRKGARVIDVTLDDD